MPTQLLPNGEPFFFPGSQVGCLLVHGFTATPMEVRRLGEYLADKGLTVLGIRLPGHATSPEHLNRVSYKEWIAAVEGGWHMLSNSCEQIFMIGMSTGASLSLYLSAFLPTAGTAALSPLIWMPHQNKINLFRPIYKLLGKFNPFLKKGETFWFNPKAKVERVIYDVNPIFGFYELDKFLRIFRKKLPEITKPTLILHSTDDTYVPHSNAQQIYDQIGSQDKQLILIDECNHVITQDGETEKVFEAVYKFVQDHTSE